MSTVSGIDPLFEKISEISAIKGQETKSIFVPAIPPITSRIGRLLNKFPKLTGQHDAYDLKDAPAPGIEPRQNSIAGKVLSAARQMPQALILLSAAESQYSSHYLMAPSSIRERIVLTMHQPVAYHRLLWSNVAALDGLRAIVCLSIDQEEYFKSITATRVIRIPLGVSHNFFQPDPEYTRESDMRLLFVGQWFRDFETLEKSFSLLKNACPSIKLDCVIPQSALRAGSLMKLAQNESVQWHTNISAQKLLELYRNCTIVFIPLLDAAANCAILEAFACGKPVISTRVGGAQEYFSGRFGELCEPGDAYSHFRALQCWLQNLKRCKSAGLEARKYVEKTRTWDTIAIKMIEEIERETQPS